MIYVGPDELKNDRTPEVGTLSVQTVVKRVADELARVEGALSNLEEHIMLLPQDRRPSEVLVEMQSIDISLQSIEALREFLTKISEVLPNVDIDIRAAKQVVKLGELRQRLTAQDSQHEAL